MEALDDMLRRDWEQEVWRSYVAGMLWRVDGAWGGKDTPRYEDLIAEEEAEMDEEEIRKRRQTMIDKNNAG